MWIIGIVSGFERRMNRLGTVNRKTNSRESLHHMGWDFLTSPIAQGVIWTAAAIILALAGWSYVTGWRDRNSTVGTDVDVLSNFRELRQQGVLDDDEFRTIKANMGGRDKRRDKS